MAIQRMDNVGIVVDDLEAAVAFFLALAWSCWAKMPVEGRWVDGVVGLDMSETTSQRCGPPTPRATRAMKFHTPSAIDPEPKNAPANTLGIECEEDKAARAVLGGML
jgi:hypothetical protein